MKLKIICNRKPIVQQVIHHPNPNSDHQHQHQHFQYGYHYWLLPSQIQILIMSLSASQQIIHSHSGSDLATFSSPHQSLTSLFDPIVMDNIPSVLVYHVEIIFNQKYLTLVPFAVFLIIYNHHIFSLLYYYSSMQIPKKYYFKLFTHKLKFQKL